MTKLDNIDDIVIFAESRTRMTICIVYSLNL